ncbi:VOC family protein [Saccharopolyspora sp. K220]|uniref:VOC family protein n=1 Tax=Saccharopolyspora soli TaxID=2926618 RepID=UPI001F56AEB1|nr:VOC family protein [Saccharopolyspora soli]MCI2424316.1 VOC family protein [Saccharopolyspora soli]
MPHPIAVAHITLTVTDLSVSVPWYSKLLDREPVLDEDTGPFHHVGYALDNVMIGLHCFPAQSLPDGTATDRFNEFRPGLDHLAFACADRYDLVAQGRRLDELGIAHSGIVDAPYGFGLSFRDPDNIALEFFAPPADNG